MTVPPRSRWRLQLESVAAGMLSAALVSGLIVIAGQLGWMDQTSSRWLMVIGGSPTGVIVAAQYLKNRGIDS